MLCLNRSAGVFRHAHSRCHSLLSLARRAARRAKRKTRAADRRPAGPDRRGRHRSRGARRPLRQISQRTLRHHQGTDQRAKSPARSRRIDDELQDFSALMDELGDNLDVFSERKADIRKSLKPLNEGIQRWQGVLHDLPSEPGFELSLKEALDSVERSCRSGQTAHRRPGSLLQSPPRRKRTRTATSRSETAVAEHCYSAFGGPRRRPHLPATSTAPSARARPCRPSMCASAASPR